MTAKDAERREREIEGEKEREGERESLQVYCCQMYNSYVMLH